MHHATSQNLYQNFDAMWEENLPCAQEQDRHSIAPLGYNLHR